MIADLEGPSFISSTTGTRDGALVTHDPSQTLTGKSLMAELPTAARPEPNSRIGRSKGADMSAQELDEEVRVSAYDPAWPGTASRLSSQVAQLLTEIDSMIEHIGSTAVPGLDAKPVIDLMVGVEHQSKIDEAARKLVANGWKDFGEAGVAGRRYLRQRATDDCNVHIVLAGGEHWANNLALRDYL